jgi:hypothetical protein
LKFRQALLDRQNKVLNQILKPCCEGKMFLKF